MEEFIVKKKITINAEPAAVWDALTNPEKTKKYFFNCRVFSRWKAGSSITFKGTMFLLKKIEMRGRITDIDPGKFLKYTLKNKKSPGISTITDELTYENGKTTLSLTDNVGIEAGAEKRYNRSLKGWNKILKNLKKLVEKEL